MEKRRRARINESLGQLKTLILDALKKDVSWVLEAKPDPGWSGVGGDFWLPLVFLCEHGVPWRDPMWVWIQVIYKEARVGQWVGMARRGLRGRQAGLKGPGVRKVLKHTGGIFFFFPTHPLSPNMFCLLPPELQAFQAWESRYPGDDSQALTEPPTCPDDRWEAPFSGGGSLGRKEGALLLNTLLNVSHSLIKLFTTYPSITMSYLSKDKEGPCPVCPTNLSVYCIRFLPCVLMGIFFFNP